MNDLNLRRRMQALTAPHPSSDRRTDLHNAPNSSLNPAQHALVRDDLVDETERLRNELEGMSLANWAEITAGCYTQAALDKIDDMTEYFQDQGQGPALSNEQQTLVDSMIATVIAAGQANQQNPRHIPIITATGQPAQVSSQQMAELVADAAEGFGMSDNQKFMFTAKKILAKVFFGAAAMGTTTLRTTLVAVVSAISQIADTIVMPLPATRRRQGKLAIKGGLYIIFSYYIIPALGSMAFKKFMDCGADACARVAESCSIMGGKRKSRKHRGHKKRKSRKGYKSHKRKRKKGKTHKRKGRKGNKSRRRKH